MRPPDDMFCLAPAISFSPGLFIAKPDLQRHPWLASHGHVVGLYIWVLENVKALAEPVPCRGKQGFWLTPGEVDERIREQLETEVSS